MSDTDISLEHGDEYVVFYVQGPYDGQTDRRISTDGSFDETITVLTDFDGKNGQSVYGSPVAKQVGDSVQVTYTYVPTDSDSLEDVDERLSEQ